MKPWTDLDAKNLAEVLTFATNLTIEQQRPSKTITTYVLNNLNINTLSKFKFYSGGCTSLIDSIRDIESQNFTCTECGFRWTLNRQKLICEICYITDVVKYKALRKHRTNETTVATKKANGGFIRTQASIEKSKVTNQKKYGGNSPMCNALIIAKSQITSKLNHGGVLHQKVASVKLKSKATYKEKTGYEHPSQNPVVKKATQSTNIVLYGNVCSLHGKEQKALSQIAWGTDNPMQNESTKEAAKVTWRINNDGYDHPMKNPEFYKQFVAKTLETLGVTHNSKLQRIKDKKVEKCMTDYGVENISQIQEVKDKKVVTSLKNFGVYNPMQNREVFLKANVKNKNIYNISINDKNYKVQGSYEVALLEILVNKFGVNDVSSQFSVEYPKEAIWFPDFYIHSKDMYIECKSTYYLYGVPELLVKNRIKAQNLPNCTWYVLHNKIWLRLPKDWYLTLNVAMLIEELWYQKTGIIQPWMLSLTNYICSIDSNVKRSSNICIVGNTAIVMNSLYWASNTKINNDHTLKIKQNLEIAGYRVVVIWEHTWRVNNKVTRKFLSNILKVKTNTVFARKCIVKSSSLNNELCEFYNNNHMQGAPKHGTTYYLEYENFIVAAMTFSYTISNRGSIKDVNVYELVRYATACNVPGGASKLLKAFLNKENPKLIISYSDNQMFTGGMYKALNFTNKGLSKPDYKVWFGKNVVKSKQAVSRKLLELNYLENFNEKETEKENCKRLGIHRIYDCGKIKWELDLRTAILL